MQRLQRVALVGGTHGNELAGVEIVKHLQRMAPALHTSFELLPVISNVTAVQRVKRYIDTDLNRCFTVDELKKGSATVEAKRAAELNKKFGVKGSKSPNMDFIIDLHNSTANTGILLCFHELDTFSREVYGYLHSKDPSIRGSYWQKGEVSFLPSVSKSGLTLEVGPVAHGTLHMAALQRTKKVVMDTLAYIEARNKAIDSPIRKIKKVDAPIFLRHSVVDYPRNPDKSIAAYIHPKLQGIAELQEGSFIRNGQPVFMKVDGTEIVLDFEKHAVPLSGFEHDSLRGDPGDFYPMFVNEAAYYEKATAMFLALRRTVSVDVVDVP